MTLLELKNCLANLSDEQLKQPFMVWGENIDKQLITEFHVCEEDMIDPNGFGAELVSTYMDSEDNEEREMAIYEPRVARKGDIYFLID